MDNHAIKLNLGSGDKPLHGYINLDAKKGDCIFPLSAANPDDGVDEIRASHVLEHFPHSCTLEILQHWTSKLKPGGVLKIAVPDFTKIARTYLEGNNPPAEAYIMGGQSDEYDYHKALFDEPGLRRMLLHAGLTDIEPWESEIEDCASLNISLNLKGTKAAKVAPDESRPLKVAAIMSVPRLTFTENVACIYRTIAELDIECHAGTGVFWGQVMTRQIEGRIADGADYILAVDYDSWFLPQHVMKLVELMRRNPEADAVCAVQCHREDEMPILGIHDEQGEPRHRLPRAMFEQPLTQIHVGHFGLTLFRAACFAKLSRPWFWPRPDENGSWHEGRQDDDITFWRNFEAAGCKLFLANEVSIGHLQLICTFPGPAAENWRPVHVYLKDLNAGRVPEHCLVKGVSKWH